jgi:hypothetical protein
MAKMFLLNKSQKLDQLKRRKEAKKKKKSQKQLDQEEQKFLLKKGVKKEGE